MTNVKSTVLIAIVAMAVGMAAHASTSIIWGGASATGFFLSAPGTPIEGDSTGAQNDGGLAQLLWVGEDGYSGLNLANPHGVSGNDEWVADARMGLNFPAVIEDGNFQATAGHTYSNGSQFAILYFDNPSPGYSGTLPTSGEYGYIEGLYSTAAPQDSFDQTGGASPAPTWLPVPEPSVMALAFAGIATILVRRKVKK